jgi:hypothetical protein
MSSSIACFDLVVQYHDALHGSIAESLSYTSVIKQDNDLDIFSCCYVDFLFLAGVGHESLMLV